jgi:hypothetical protein
LGTRLRLAEVFIYEREQQKLFALAQDESNPNPEEERGGRKRGFNKWKREL